MTELSSHLGGGKTQALTLLHCFGPNGTTGKNWVAVKELLAKEAVKGESSMQPLKTATGSPFQYKEDQDGEIIVYASDENGQPQTRSALVITPYIIDLITRTIQQRGRVLVGASRDKPPAGSLGALIKREKQSPQQLSYLIPILERRGICRIGRDGQAIVVTSVATP